jgi:hypothetical protein
MHAKWLFVLKCAPHYGVALSGAFAGTSLDGHKRRLRMKHEEMERMCFCGICEVMISRLMIKKASAMEIRQLPLARYVRLSNAMKLTNPLKRREGTQEQEAISNEEEVMCWCCKSVVCVSKEFNARSSQLARSHLIASSFYCYTFFSCRNFITFLSPITPQWTRVFSHGYNDDLSLSSIIRQLTRLIYD